MCGILGPQSTQGCLFMTERNATNVLEGLDASHIDSPLNPAAKCTEATFRALTSPLRRPGEVSFGKRHGMDKAESTVGYTLMCATRGGAADATARRRCAKTEALPRAGLYFWW